MTISSPGFAVWSVPVFGFGRSTGGRNEGWRRSGLRRIACPGIVSRIWYRIAVCARACVEYAKIVNAESAISDVVLAKRDEPAPPL